MKYCQDQGIVVTGYSPTGGNPDYSGPRPREDELVLEIAKKRGKAINQVSFTFLQYSLVTTVPLRSIRLLRAQSCKDSETLFAGVSNQFVEVSQQWLLM